MEKAAHHPASPWPARAQRLLQRRRAPLFAGALVMALILLVWSAAAPQGFTTVFESLDAVDIEQGRLDTALPAPQGTRWIEQSFVPRHNGLTEVEVTLLRYGDALPDEPATLTLQLLDGAGHVVAEKALPAAVIAHNQVERLTFPAQPASAGQQYTLRLLGSPDNQVSLWGYSLDVYADGAVALGAEAITDPAATTAQDIRFSTRYRLGWPDALRTLGTAVFYEGLLLALALLLLPLPGVLALYLYRRLFLRRGAGVESLEALVWDPAAWWAVALALGAALWPLLWLWSTLAGWHWSGWSLAALLGGGWLAAAVLWARESRRAAGVPLAVPWRAAHLLLLGVLLLGFAARLLAVRDVAFLPWVDASRHGLITAVMIASGQVIRDYAPYLPVNRFPYHFGFHALSTSLALLTQWPLERLLLYLGQLLNSLVPLTLFGAVWLLLRRRSAALFAALLVALPFFFPAYYTTWGRLTQLTAVLLLPILIALTWQLARGHRGWTTVWWLVAILVAGLFLIHVRVFVYYLPFALLVWLAGRLRRTVWLAAAGGLALLLVAPHLHNLQGAVNPQRPFGGSIPDYNAFPVSYVTTGWEQIFYGAAALGLLLVVYGLWRRQDWAWLPALLLAWVAVLLALLSIDRLGVPLPSLFNLNSMSIIIFVPLAIFLAVVADQIWRWLVRQSAAWRWAGFGTSGALLLALLVLGVRQQVMILNPQTILALPEDVPALRWLEAELPPEATLAVNSWRWLGETWAAADGGAWILPLSGRAVSTPPIDHIYNAELFAEVRAFNEAATAVTDWSAPAQAAWLAEQGFSHVFVGKRGGFLDPAQLAANPGLEMVYGKDGVFVFAVRE